MGAPKRHPTALHVRMLPLWVEKVGPSVAVWAVQLVMRNDPLPRSGTVIGSGTLLPPPPMYRPPQSMFRTRTPIESRTSPQSPGPAWLEKCTPTALLQQPVLLEVEDVLVVDDVLDDELDETLVVVVRVVLVVLVLIVVLVVVVVDDEEVDDVLDDVLNDVLDDVLVVVVVNGAGSGQAPGGGASRRERMPGSFLAVVPPN
jgi:hypothetical protein